MLGMDSVWELVQVSIRVQGPELVLELELECVLESVRVAELASVLASVWVYRPESARASALVSVWASAVVSVWESVRAQIQLSQTQ